MQTLQCDGRAASDFGFAMFTPMLKISLSGDNPDIKQMPAAPAKSVDEIRLFAGFAVCGDVGFAAT